MRKPSKSHSVNSNVYLGRVGVLLERKTNTINRNWKGINSQASHWLIHTLTDAQYIPNTSLEHNRCSVLHFVSKLRQ